MFIGHTFDTYVLGVFASTNFANIPSKNITKVNMASENHHANVKTYN